jgi:hypothetical protein
MAFLPGLVRADVTLDSGAGLTACMFSSYPGTCGLAGDGVTTTGKTVTITPDLPAYWEPNNPTNPGDSGDTTAVWIGAVESGYGDPTFVPSQTTPVYEITDTFTSTAGTLLLDVWADDSVNVYLNGSLLPPPGTPNQGSICSGQPASCQPMEDGVFTGNVLNGSNTLTFDVYQTGTGTDTTSNPTGLLFTGTVSTPEPASVAILLAMLVGVAGFAGILKKKLA